jgi:leucyl-tRNA synthetase
MNVLEKAPQATEQDRALLQEGLEAVTLLLAPITPHISHELWQQLGHAGSVIDAAWPSVDEQALVQDTCNWWFRSTASCAARSTCLPPPAAKKSKPPPAATRMSCASPKA